MKTPLRLTGFILILCLNVAYADSTEDAAPPAADDAAATAVASANQDSGPDSTAGAAKATGMHMPVDGSNLEAFDASLEEIRKNSTAPDYSTLENAIDFLLFYELRAKGDRAKLAELLDGQTGEQIIARSESRRNKKNH